MGCVSSRHAKKELRRDIILNNGGGKGDGDGECVVNHIVSLTSSTYGVLKLDNEQNQEKEQQEQELPVKEIVAEAKKTVMKGSPPREPEVINAWELMEGLEEELPITNHTKKSPKTRVLFRGFADMEGKRSPLKFLNQFGSPRKVKKLGGKENKVRVNTPVKSDFSPKSVLKVNNFQESSCKKALNLNSPVLKTESLGFDSGASSRRRSFSPLFDPVLIANYEKELSEGEQIKRIISPTFSSRNCKSSPESTRKHLVKKCPPGGENAVVIYTTTLRGIRKTFEDCNKVRSIIESHQVRTFERDISMDLGLKEELRGLLETREVKVPLVFVKGRLVGGVDEVLKLDEEGKLEILFDGIPEAIGGGGCDESCGGVRFVMCMECNGSCKVLDEGQKKMIRCGVCNENGLIQCPICC